MHRNRATWLIIGGALLILILAVVLTPAGRDMNASPGTLSDVPTEGEP